MKNDWIMDVLADLKNFARANGLPALADQLAESADLAAVEIASNERRAKALHGDEFASGNHPAEAGDGRRG
jgi:hypothetical protein